MRGGNKGEHRRKGHKACGQTDGGQRRRQRQREVTARRGERKWVVIKCLKEESCQGFLRRGHSLYMR